MTLPFLGGTVEKESKERLPVSPIFAGLQAAVSGLLNEGVATFLRRADRIDLHTASVTEAERSFAETFADAGIILSAQLTREAAEATGGHPS